MIRRAHQRLLDPEDQAGAIAAFVFFLVCVTVGLYLLLSS